MFKIKLEEKIIYNQPVFTRKRETMGGLYHRESILAFSRLPQTQNNYCKMWRTAFTCKIRNFPDFWFFALTICFRIKGIVLGFNQAPPPQSIGNGSPI